jgi:L-asparaginase
MDFTIITTGGTIDKNYGSDKGTYNFSLDSPKVGTILDKLPNAIHNYTVTELLQLDSLDMEDHHREQISEACKDTATQNILITHGTDTMIDTANKLQELDLNKTIVLTGSSKPERMKDTDADINIGLALGGLQTLSNGVYIAIHGEIHNPTELKKTEDGVFTSD